MSSLGSMPEVKVAKEDSDAILGWVGLGRVAWFGLMLFYSIRFEGDAPFALSSAALLPRCKPSISPSMQADRPPFPHAALDE